MGFLARVQAHGCFAIKLACLFSFEFFYGNFDQPLLIGNCVRLVVSREGNIKICDSQNTHVGASQFSFGVLVLQINKPLLVLEDSALSVFVDVVKDLELGLSASLVVSGNQLFVLNISLILFFFLITGSCLCDIVMAVVASFSGFVDRVYAAIYCRAPS